MSAGLLGSLASSSHGEDPMGILHPGAEGSEDDATWGQSLMCTLYEVIKAELPPCIIVLNIVGRIRSPAVILILSVSLLWTFCFISCPGDTEISARGDTESNHNLTERF